MRYCLKLASLSLLAIVMVTSADAQPKADIIQAAASIATSEAAARVQQSFQLYWGLLTAIAALFLALFTFIGFAQVRDLRQSLTETVLSQLRREVLSSPDFKKDIQNAVEQSVLSGITTTISAIERRLSFTRMQQLANEVEQGQSFSNAQRDVLYSSIIEIKNDPEIAATEEFKLVLEKVVDSFAAAGIWHLVDRLEVELQEIFRNYSGISLTVFQGYGMRLLGEYQDSPDVNLSDKFLFWADVCQDHKARSTISVYLICYYHNINSADAKVRIDNIFEDILYWRNVEKKLFISAIYQLVNAPVRSGLIARTVEKFKAVEASYGQRLAEIAQSITDQDDDDISMPHAGKDLSSFPSPSNAAGDRAGGIQE